MNKININLRINNTEVNKKINANEILSDFIRYDLKLTGTHIGCDTSQCGSCIVMIDGKCVKSCSILLAQCSGKPLQQSSLGDKDRLHALQIVSKIIMAFSAAFVLRRIIFCIEVI